MSYLEILLKVLLHNYVYLQIYLRFDLFGDFHDNNIDTRYIVFRYVLFGIMMIIFDLKLKENKILKQYKYVVTYLCSIVWSHMLLIRELNRNFSVIIVQHKSISHISRLITTLRCLTFKYKSKLFSSIIK